jgi:adenine nucleotide transporter 17
LLTANYLCTLPGIGPKVTQSVLTAAFLFAFKDVLYEYSVRLRRSVAKQAITA